MQLLKIKQVAAMISCHPQTIRRMVRRGEFPPHTHQVTPRHGNRWSEDSVRAWMKRHQTEEVNL